MVLGPALQELRRHVEPAAVSQGGEAVAHLVPAAYSLERPDSLDKSLESPKSPIFTLPSCMMKMLAGLRSLGSQVISLIEEVDDVPPVDNAKVVDEEETLEELVDDVKGTEGSKLLVCLVCLEVGEVGGVAEEGGEVVVVGPVGPELVEELLEGVVTELHLDAQAGQGGGVARAHLAQG